MTKDEHDNPGEARQEAALERAVRIGQLLDLYGPLLTDRQREFMHLHYGEDLSFGEIAAEAGVSRQAIHDAVKHAEQALEGYDEKLGLTPEFVAGRRRGKSSEGGEPDAPAASPGGTPPVSASAPSPGSGAATAAEALEAIVDRLRRSGGVLYNVDGLIRELEELAQSLRSTSSS